MEDKVEGQEEDKAEAHEQMSVGEQMSRSADDIRRQEKRGEERMGEEKRGYDKRREEKRTPSPCQIQQRSNPQCDIM